MADRMTNPNWAGPKAAAFYVANGLRVLPIHPKTKEAARRGFGKAAPDFCTPPEQFRAGELIAILMGPCPLGNFAGGRQLCGLDLDAPFDLAALEGFVGPLPRTLSSKNGRHLYFWITPARQEKGELSQGNDVFKTKSLGRGALDLRPAAGGYFLERGDWDAPGFFRENIRDLPDAAFDALLAARNTRRGRPVAPCPLSLNAFEGDESSPFNRLGEPVLNDLARELARLWPLPGQGGGHDLALALGGILADAYGSLDDVCDFAARVHYYAQAPDASAEVAASVTRRRSGIRTGIFGWPTLKRMLVAAAVAKGCDETSAESQVRSTLHRLKATIPGLDREGELAKARAQKRVALVAEFNALGQPRARELGLKAALEAFLYQKKNAPEPTSPGAPSLPTNQPTEEES
jgi:bifunctional DNA primase/polymerase-like protein